MLAVQYEISDGTVEERHEESEDQIGEIRDHHHESNNPRAPSNRAKNLVPKTCVLLAWELLFDDPWPGETPTNARLASNPQAASACLRA